MEKILFELKSTLENRFGSEDVVYKNWNLYDTTSPFTVLSAGVTHPNSEYLIVHDLRDPCLNRMYILECVLDGTGVIETEKQRIHIKKGDLYFINLEKECLYYSDSQNPLHKIWINFNGTSIPDLLKIYNLSEPVTVVSSSKSTENYFEAIISLLSNLDKTAIPQTMGAVFQYINRIFSFMSSYKDERGALIAFSASNIKTIIDTAPYYHVTVREIAQAYHYSERHISRIFTEEFGISPKEYILQQRIEHAKKILVNSSVSLKEIANLLHFYDVHHFCNCFRRIVGMAPGTYRKENGKEQD